MSKTRLRALIYNRASADATGRAFSVDSQDRENHAWCDREDWEVAGTITDNDRSASRWASREREGYTIVRRALAGETHGRVDVLVCWESSRANRDLEFYVELRNLCAETGVLYAYKGRVYDLSTGDDRFATGLDALVDEREAERARERTQRSHRNSVEAGTPRGFAPYGYARTYDAHSGRLLDQIPDPETSAVVQGIVERIIDGDTLYSISQGLNRDGVLTPRARHAQLLGRRVNPDALWTSSIIRNLLHKQSLMGIRTYQGQAQRQGTWDPIVSAADWAQVQAILADPHRARHNGGVKVRYLLSGIAECGVCHAWLRPFTNRGRPTYRCEGASPTSPRGHVSRLRPPLDAYVTQYVCNRLADPALLEAMATRREGAAQRSAEIVREIADLQAELAQYVRSAGQRKGLAAQAFTAVADDLAAQIEARQQELTLAAEVPAVVLELAGPDAPQRWASLDRDSERGLHRQRQIVRALVRVVVHRSGARGQRQFDASSVELIKI